MINKDMMHQKHKKTHKQHKIEPTKPKSEQIYLQAWKMTGQ